MNHGDAVEASGAGKVSLWPAAIVGRARTAQEFEASRQSLKGVAHTERYPAQPPGGKLNGYARRRALAS